MRGLVDAVLSFKKDAPDFPLVTLANEDATVKAIRSGSASIDPTLATAYASNLQSAVGSVLSSSDGDITMAAKVNVSKFAYFKAAEATSQVRAAATTDDALKELNKFNRWQATEYNTAVARARSAKQWQGFEKTKEFLPNLKWVQSRSVNPREEHIAYWGRVWSKDDPFWAMNQPGNAYGCKCDWVETSEPVSGGNKRVETRTCAQGLEVNAGIQGEIFTMGHPYIGAAKGNESLIRSIAQKEVVYDGVRISLLADSKKIKDNIATARTLAKGGETVLVRPDFNVKNVGFAKGEKNPDLEINGITANAKRVMSEAGISNGFNKAKKQGCQSLVIEFKDGNTPNINKVANAIDNRDADFLKGEIKCCFVVWRGKYATIDAGLFKQHSKDKSTRRNIIADKLKKALL